MAADLDFLPGILLGRPALHSQDPGHEGGGLGVRFDYGQYPYARTVEEDGSVDRYGITAFVDPFRLLAAQ